MHNINSREFIYIREKIDEYLELKNAEVYQLEKIEEVLNEINAKYGD